jgi:hypothetical protein
LNRFEELLNLRDNHQAMRTVASFILLSLFVLISVRSGLTAETALAGPSDVSQEKIPAPPADRTLIYVRDDNGELQPLAFEAGTTPLHLDMVAKANKLSRVELKGARATTIISSYEPHFYLFVPDEASPHPPLLVRLTQKNNARRVTVMAQRGFRGFAVASEEIVKPRYRVLTREGGMIFLEIWPRVPLLAGEYAFVGSDLQHVAAFSVK